MSERFTREEADRRDPDLAAPGLTALYRDASREEPPAAIDAAILAAARASTETSAATHGGGGEPRWSRWRAPFAIAAVLVLSATLVIQMRDEPQSPLDPAVLADIRAKSQVARDRDTGTTSARDLEHQRAGSHDRPPPAAHAPATGRVDGPPREAAGVASERAGEVVAGSADKATNLAERRDLAANRASETERQAVAPALPSSAPASPPPPPTPDLVPSSPAPERAFGSEARPALSAAAPPGTPSSESKRAAPRASIAQSSAPTDPAGDRDRTSRASPSPFMSRPDVAAPVPASPPASAAAPVPSPPRSEEGAIGQSGERSRAASSADASRSETFASDSAASVGRVAAPERASSSPRESARKVQAEESPEQWLARIERLFREGRDLEAKEALDAFRKRHPTHELPAALRGR